MTKVKLATTSVATESTAESSTGIFTPRSDSVLGFPSGSAYQPIPSIEGGSDSLSDDNYTINTLPLSITQPGRNASRAANSKGKAVLHEGCGTDSIDAHLENMHISSADSRLGMSDVARAIEGVTSDVGNPVTLLEPRHPGIEDSSSNRPFSRWRSSSRVNTTPHAVRDEDPPEDRFHEPAFQQAFTDAKGLMSELTDVLGSNSMDFSPDSTMQQLHIQARKLADYQCSPRTVGFVGDSGVGKSSLLNSLLDIRGLARTSNSGAACTCVVTEYHYHDTDDFAIEIELFKTEKLTEQITELLQSYRHYHLNGMDMDRDAKKDFEERAKIAQDTFRAMFRGRLDSEEFLTTESEDSVLGTLLSWTQDMGPSAIRGKQVGLNLVDCSSLLMQFTSEQTSTQEPSVWPYIEKIKVFLNAHILNNGLVLVDLPGLRDLNSARQKVTERYVRHECKEIFAVCYIGRATTDVGVRAMFELARQAELSNVGIICTKSDDIRAEEAEKDWKGKRADEIRQLIDTVARDQLDLQNVNGQLEDYADNDLSEEEKEFERELHRRSRKAKKLLDDHEFKLKHHLVTIRNNSVMENLNALYRSRVPGGTLRVFCVSNTDYWEHRDLPKDDALPLLQLSGIIALRRHCISIVANSQLRFAMNYIRHSIPAILGDIALWVQSGAGSVSEERKQAIRETLDVLEARLRRDLCGNSCQFYGISRSIKREFKTQLFERQRIHDWSQAARNAAQVWSGWHHATYSSFCRRYGDYNTLAVGPHNWNEEAIEGMIGNVAAPWQSFRSSLQNRHEATILLIEELMDWAIQYLDTELQNFSDSTATLSHALTSRQHLFETDVEEVWDKFEVGLSSLRTDALSGIRSSFIGQAMEGSYRACNYESGRGSDSKRKKIINDKFKNESLFEDLMKEFRNRFNVLANDLQSDMEGTVETHLEVFRRTLDILRSENAASESEQDPEFRGRVEAEIRTARAHVRRIQAAIGV